MHDLKDILTEHRVVVLPETDSTNRLALECGEDGVVFVADAQTAGRGRHGNRWDSAPGLGLWFSVALPAETAGLIFAAALAVRDAVRPEAALDLKWPNDLLHQGRKVCGMLVETRNGRAALGIGLNVHHRVEDFPEPLRASAGSLALAAPTVAWRRAEVLGRILAQLDCRLAQLRGGGFDAVHAAWAEACGILGRRVRRGGVEGEVKLIDREGALLVQTGCGMVRVTDARALVTETAPCCS
jgi:BirA family biotin operon repressor/biotin-[acetyl-CoA-carboxylase] ligase